MDNKVDMIERDVKRLEQEVDRLRNDVIEGLREKIDTIHARISKEATKISALAALWTVSSLVMIALVYKLFDLTAMLSKMVK